MKEIILATGNKGKIAELEAILSPIQCIPQSSLSISDAEETGSSFVENALIKARHACRIGNKPALADDSGLVVPALNGEPGIYSARYSGAHANDEKNIDRLLSRLEDYQGEKRKAFFYCAIALLRFADDPTPLIATGQLWGEISLTRRGAHGFGYDPVFYLKEYDCTLAEISANVKNTISHRARALMVLKEKLTDW